jgi:hypothetical protein
MFPTYFSHKKTIIRRTPSLKVNLIILSHVMVCFVTKTGFGLVTRFVSLITTIIYNHAQWITVSSSYHWYDPDLRHLIFSLRELFFLPTSGFSCQFLLQLKFLLLLDVCGFHVMGRPPWWGVGSVIYLYYSLSPSDRSTTELTISYVSFESLLLYTHTYIRTYTYIVSFSPGLVQQIMPYQN